MAITAWLTLHDLNVELPHKDGVGFPPNGASPFRRMRVADDPFPSPSWATETNRFDHQRSRTEAINVTVVEGSSCLATGTARKNIR